MNECVLCFITDGTKTEAPFIYRGHSVCSECLKKEVYNDLKEKLRDPITGVEK